MSKEKMIWLAIGVLVGVVAGNKIRQLPGVNKLPTV